MVSKHLSKLAFGLALAALVMSVFPVMGQGPLRRWMENRRSVRSEVMVPKYQVLPQASTNCVDGQCFAAPQMLIIPPPQSSYVPVVQQSARPVPSVPAVKTASSSEPLQVREPKFRRALVQAAKEAAAEGKISRRDALRVRVASFSPAFLAAAEELCVTQMVFSGENAELIPKDAQGNVDRTAIDWEAFGEFLKVVLPLILELLLAFGLGG